MSKTRLCTFASLICLAWSLGASASDGITVTTSLADDCMPMSSPGVAESLCRGVGDYQLILETGPLQQSLAVKSSVAQTELQFPQKVTAAPGKIADTVEWRVTPGGPYAMIVEYDTDTNPVGQPRISSSEGRGKSKDLFYSQRNLVIVKIDPQASCAVYTVDASADPQGAHHQAKKYADRAQDLGCL